MEKLSFRPIRPHEVSAAAELEARSYPEDEAATPEKIQYRSENATAFFLVAKVEDTLIGFINGTCIHGSSINHSSMSIYISEGRTLVIHSVAVDGNQRRKGIASWMLRQYLSFLKEKDLVDSVLLLSKPYLLPLYTSVGFQYRKVSEVVHGQETWLELGLNLREHFATKQWQVDAFTNRAFGGNPAAVVLQQRDPIWMQQVAMENNYAETSFLQKLGSNRYSLRW
jgi:ribosomal protein S18 acetylase RimI-like enzyme